MTGCEEHHRVKQREAENHLSGFDPFTEVSEIRQRKPEKKMQRRKQMCDSRDFP
jgi:hypothetical protein